MLKLQRITYVGVLYQIPAALTNYGMAKVTVPCDLPAVFRCEIVIMTPETTFNLQMADMIGINIICNFHSGKSVTAESILQTGN